MQTARAWAEIDLDALEHNLGRIRARLEADARADPSHTNARPPRILLVAKADAYGHGAVAVAHRALRAGVAGIAVTTCTEALELRRAGIQERLLLLGTILEEEAPTVLELDLEVEVPSLEHFRILERAAGRRGREVRVHLKIDTGMGRLGAVPDEALELVAAISSSHHVTLQGVMTHVAAGRGIADPTGREQLSIFDHWLNQARERGWLAPTVEVHAGNSACILSGAGGRYDTVRPGILAYGVPPGPEWELTDYQPVLSVRTRIVALRSLPTGATVGYEGTFRAARDSRIAVLPIGYDDGVDWRLANRGYVLIRGRRAPIVGRISMDYTTVDVTDHDPLELGERATLIGEDGDAVIRIEDLARLTESIPHVLLCSIGKRVHRVYLGQERGSSRPRVSAEGPSRAR